MCCWNSLAVQWLGLHTFTVESMGLIPGQGTEILQAMRHGQNNTKKKKKIVVCGILKNFHSLPVGFLLILEGYFWGYGLLAIFGEILLNT